MSALRSEVRSDAARKLRRAPAPYFTPNRWLVLVITLEATARLLYGVWRIWHTWRASGANDSWITGAGVSGSLAVGAVVVG